MFARLGRRAIAVALEKPLAVVATGEAADRVAELLGGSKAVHPQRRVRPRFAAGVVDDAEDRGGALARPCLGRLGRPERVGHRDADRALVQPLRTLAHPPGRREQPRLTGQPEHALAAPAPPLSPQARPTFRWPPPTHGRAAR